MFRNGNINICKIVKDRWQKKYCMRNFFSVYVYIATYIEVFTQADISKKVF